MDTVPSGRSKATWKSPPGKGVEVESRVGAVVVNGPEVLSANELAGQTARAGAVAAKTRAAAASHEAGRMASARGSTMAKPPGWKIPRPCCGPGRSQRKTLALP